MLTIFVRTCLIYVILIGTMRLMGKRQLGELEVSELVTTLLLSEIATIPLTELDVPLLYAVIPLVTILTLEITLSVILLKCPPLKNMVSTRPAVLIRHGKVEQKGLRRIRISLGELVSAIRQAGAATPTDVDYAILEPNGKISVILKKSAQPPVVSDLGRTVTESGILHILIEDGKINEYNLCEKGLDHVWLADQLKNAGKKLPDVFLLGMDDMQKLFWIDKEAK